MNLSTHTLLCDKLDFCWRRPGRAYDCQLVHELDLDVRLLTTTPPTVLSGLYILPTIPKVGTVFKDAGLREQHVVEMIWTEESDGTQLRPLYEM